MSESAAAQEVDKILGLDGREITASTRTFFVKPVSAKQLSDILKRVHNLREIGIRVEVQEGQDLADTVKKTVKTVDYLKMIMLGGDEVLYILHYATMQPRDWVFGLNLVDLVKLAQAVVEVNVDFFVQNLSVIQSSIKSLIEAKDGVEAVGIGPALSPDSLTTDTESKP